MFMIWMTYIPFERYLINESTHEYKWDSYKIATKIKDLDGMLNAKSMTFDDKLFYSFAYIGSAFVRLYVHWAIKHAIEARV